jgi:hypothetical protein
MNARSGGKAGAGWAAPVAGTNGRRRSAISNRHGIAAPFSWSVDFEEAWHCPVVISVKRAQLNLILPNHFRHDVDQTGIREVKRSQMVVSLKTRPLRFEITINGATSYLWIA